LSSSGNVPTWPIGIGWPTGPKRSTVSIANWWSWGESNPRPKAFVRQIYTLSWLICF